MICSVPIPFFIPCHGALYYQMARVNGFGFYESVPFTCAGSLMWEYIMENEQPSLNDLISTTVGGAAIGERCVEALSQTVQPLGQV